jgi:6-phosphogluconolactonase
VLFQVDERVAPAGDPDRNLTHLQQSLLAHLPRRPAAVHAMPVELGEPVEAARRYGAPLRAAAGTPAMLDLVHLGLGKDGHTASLVPHDAGLKVTDEEVAVTGPYAGRVRLTLTYPVLDHARHVLWVVTGADKAEMLGRLRRGDRTIPAGRVRSDHALLLSDRAANPLSTP